MLSCSIEFFCLPSEQLLTWCTRPKLQLHRRRSFTYHPCHRGVLSYLFQRFDFDSTTILGKVPVE